MILLKLFFGRLFRFEGDVTSLTIAKFDTKNVMVKIYLPLHLAQGWSGFSSRSTPVDLTFTLQFLCAIFHRIHLVFKQGPHLLTLHYNISVLFFCTIFQTPSLNSSYFQTRSTHVDSTFTLQSLCTIPQTPSSNSNHELLTIHSIPGMTVNLYPTQSDLLQHRLLLQSA